MPPQTCLHTKRSYSKRGASTCKSRAGLGRAQYPSVRALNALVAVCYSIPWVGGLNALHHQPVQPLYTLHLKEPRYRAAQLLVASPQLLVASAPCCILVASPFCIALLHRLSSLLHRESFQSDKPSCFNPNPNPRLTCRRGLPHAQHLLIIHTTGRRSKG